MKQNQAFSEIIWILVDNFIIKPNTTPSNLRISSGPVWPWPSWYRASSCSSCVPCVPSCRTVRSGALDAWAQISWHVSKSSAHDQHISGRLATAKAGSESEHEHYTGANLSRISIFGTQARPGCSTSQIIYLRFSKWLDESADTKRCVRHFDVHVFANAMKYAVKKHLIENVHRNTNYK